MDLETRYTPDFVSAPGELFDAVRGKTRWDTRMKARLTASFGVPYDYSQLVYEAAPFLDELVPLRRRVEAVIGHPATSCLANLYETGSHAMGWHSDSEPSIVRGSSIAVVSLGARRPIEFRAEADPSETRSIMLESGSLLVMAQSVQDLWRHRLPRVDGAAARISLTFRWIVRGGA